MNTVVHSAVAWSSIAIAYAWNKHPQKRVMIEKLKTLHTRTYIDIPLVQLDMDNKLGLGSLFLCHFPA